MSRGLSGHRWGDPVEIWERGLVLVNFDDMFSRFDMTSEYDGQTNRYTDVQISCDSMDGAVEIASPCKNVISRANNNVRSR